MNDCLLLSAEWFLNPVRPYQLGNSRFLTVKPVRNDMIHASMTAYY